MTFSAHAFLGDAGAGWAQIPYLVKILAENIKQYQQLKMMLEQSRNNSEYLRLINRGLENSVGLLRSLPIQDEKVLEQIKNFQGALKTVEDVYGKIPRSSEAGLQLLHDQTAAEGLKMVNSVKDYGQKQEENALKIAIEGREASPKGAARMAVESNAQILHTLAQLLRVNAQMLKLQSEQLAMNNKHSKDSVEGLNKAKSDMKESFSGFKCDYALPRF